MTPVKKWVLALVAMVAIAFIALDVMQKRGPESPMESTSLSKGGKPADSKATRVVPERSKAEREAHARQLVTILSQIDVQSARTPATSEAMHRNLLALVDEGKEAVPAIAEFLQTERDVRFDSGRGTRPLEERTLRLALIRVLFDIPTPDNVDLQVQLLGVTRDPDEVVLLARQLEMQEKGQHRDAIVAAARASLASVRRGEFAGRDTSALTRMLRQFETTAK